MSEAALPCWEEVEDQVNASSVLLGNGFSINLSDRFDYKSLFQAATLAEESRGLFKRLGINDGNFERVLADLTITRSVMLHLGISAEAIQVELDKIRNALIDAVRLVHPDQADLPPFSLPAIRRALGGYEHVFTTNYDLILYWATLFELPYVGSDSFRKRDGKLVYVPQEGAAKPPTIHYLHGALHLTVDDETANTEKVEITHGASLLEGIESSWRGGRVPMFVSEGTSRQKLRTIDRHRYLVDQLSALNTVSGGLVVLGHQLAETVDDHIVDAINEARKRNKIGIAVGLFQGDPTWEEQRASIKRRVSGEIVFFDSRCHPLMPQRPQSLPGRMSLRAALCPP